MFLPISSPNGIREPRKCPASPTSPIEDLTGSVKSNSKPPGFSSLAVQILDHIGADFVGVDVLQDEGLRDGIKTFSDWPTIPQLYVKGEFVGGSDIVREMFNAGELQALMAEKGVPLGEQAEA